MEFLRRVLGQIQNQLGALTLTQKFVIFLLLVIMCGAIWKMVDYSSQREMVQLLRQDFTPDEMTAVVEGLDSLGAEYRVEEARILVPATERHGLLIKLSSAQALPQDTSIGWGYLVEDADMFVPESVRDDRRLVVKQAMLAEMISGWPDVKSARVIINAGEKNRAVSRYGPSASASVTVEMKRFGTGTRQRALAIADIVAGANKRMKREDITVVIDGKLFDTPAAGEGLDSDYLEQKANYEESYIKKVRDALGIPNVLVQVDVKLQVTRKEKRTTRVFDEKSGSWNPTVKTDGREDKANSSTTQEEPGTVANVGQAAPATGASESETSEENAKLTQAFPGSEETHETTPMGGVTELTATVRVPRSYFVAVAKQEAGGEDDPAADVVTDVIGREIPKLKDVALHALGLQKGDEDRLSVDSYWDGDVFAKAGGLSGAMGAGEGGTGGAGAEAGVVGIMRNYGKHIAVSALAMVSLLMVLMMVRKAAGPVEMSEEEAVALMSGDKPLDALSLEESNLADGMSGGLLAGLELGEDAIRSQQMLDQVKEMVTESPEVAGNLVKKWISEDM